MIEKRFLLEPSDYDLKYEFRIADLSRVEKTKEDFWNEKAECYMYIEFLTYLYGHGAFLTQEDADIVLNELSDENKQLKQQLEDCIDVNVRCCNEYSYFHKQMMKLEKENKQLKEEKEHLKFLIRNRICYLKNNDFKLLERDKYTEIIALLWVLDLLKE